MQWEVHFERDKKENESVSIEARPVVRLRKAPKVQIPDEVREAVFVRPSPSRR